MQPTKCENSECFEYAWYGFYGNVIRVAFVCLQLCTSCTTYVSQIKVSLCNICTQKISKNKYKAKFLNLPDTLVHNLSRHHLSFACNERTTRKFPQRDHDINFRLSLRNMTPKPMQSYKGIHLLQLCKPGVVNVTLSFVF